MPPNPSNHSPRNPEREPTRPVDDPRAADRDRSLRNTVPPVQPYGITGAFDPLHRLGPAWQPLGPTPFPLGPGTGL